MDIGTTTKYYIIFPSDYGTQGEFIFRESYTGHFSSTEVDYDCGYDVMEYRVDSLSANNNWNYFNSVMWI